METTPKSRPIFLMLPLLLLLVVIANPAWRHLMTSQLRLIYQVPRVYAWTLRLDNVKGEYVPESDPGEEQKAVNALGSAHPEDYQIQLAQSLLTEFNHADNLPDDRVKRLDALAGEFPARATVYAHMLRYETGREVKIRRNSEFENVVNEIPKSDIKLDPEELRPPPDLSLRLDEFDRYAAAGEKLEPDNAYFPMMRAIGQFAALNDNAAEESIRIAGSKQIWDDHLTDELQSDWVLGGQAFGDHSAALRAAILGGVGSPHLAQLVDLGKAALVAAIKLEKNGDIKQGASLRLAMMHCGSLMRRQAHTVRGAVAGCDIGYQQIYRPGGAPPIKENVDFSQKEREEQRRTAFYNYVKSAGLASEIGFLQGEFPAELVIQKSQKVIANSNASPYGKHALRVTSYWLVDCVLLANIVSVMIPVLIVTPLTVRKKLASSTLTITLVIVFSVVVALSTQLQWSQALTGLRVAFNNWISANSGSTDHSQSGTITDNLFGSSALSILLSLIGPALLLGWMYYESRKSDIVMIDWIKLSMVRTGSLIASIFLVLYLGSIMVTARQDASLHHDLDQMIVNEGKFLASRTGTWWSP